MSCLCAGPYGLCLCAYFPVATVVARPLVRYDEALAKLKRALAFDEEAGAHPGGGGSGGSGGGGGGGSGREGDFVRGSGDSSSSLNINGTSTSTGSGDGVRSDDTTSGARGSCSSLSSFASTSTDSSASSARGLINSNSKSYVTLSNMATVLRAQGRLDESLECSARALRLATARDPESLDVAAILHNMANALQQQAGGWRRCC